MTDILGDYAEEHAPTTKSPARIAYAVASLTGFWEARTVVEVTKETCRAYVRSRRVSDGTTRRELGVLRAAINYAHGEGRLTRTVVVHLPDPGEARDRWLTRPEAGRLLRAAIREPRVRLHLPLFIVLGLYTGQRKQAILSLRWPQVDLERAGSTSTARASAGRRSGGRTSRSRPSCSATCGARRSVGPISAMSSTRTDGNSATSSGASPRRAKPPAWRTSPPTRCGTPARRG